MNCEEAREAFSDLYDGTLSGAPLAILSRHLDGCPACTAEWGAFRRAMQGLKALGDEEPSPGFAARVIDRIEAPSWCRRAAAALVFPLRVKVPIHAAVLVLLGLAGIWAFQRSPELRRAADVGSPAPMERPAAMPPAAPALHPPTGARRTEATPRTPSAPSATAVPEAPAPALAPSSAEKPDARATEGAGQAPAARDHAAQLVTPPAALPTKTEAAKRAAPMPQQAAPAPPESRGEAKSTLRTDTAIPAREGALSARARRSVDDVFSAAATEFAAQDYDAAIADLRAFLAQYPNDGRTPDARFLLADAYRAQGRYAEAGTEFEAFLRQYPKDRRVPVALYRQGEMRLLRGDRSGCDTLRDALNRYPDAREAATARETLAARCP
jgi:tol-pal system protein YbgF